MSGDERHVGQGLGALHQDRITPDGEWRRLRDSELRGGRPALEPGDEGRLLAGDVATRGLLNRTGRRPSPTPTRSPGAPGPTRRCRHGHRPRTRRSRGHRWPWPRARHRRGRGAAPHKTSPVLLAGRFALHGVHRQSGRLCRVRTDSACVPSESRRPRVRSTQRPASDQAVRPGAVAAARQRNGAVRGEMASWSAADPFRASGQDPRREGGAGGPPPTAQSPSPKPLSRPPPRRSDVSSPVTWEPDSATSTRRSSCARPGRHSESRIREPFEP